MIGSTSKINDEKRGFFFFMSNGVLNNMLLFHGLCVAGLIGVNLSLKDKGKRKNIMILLSVVMIVGSIPFVAADEESVYKYIRSANSDVAREAPGTEGQENTVQKGECNEQHCLVSGKIILKKKDYVGSVSIIDLTDGSTDFISKTMRLVTKDYSSVNGLSFEYAQCDYGIGIVEGSTFDGDIAEPESNWKNHKVFYDNAENVVDLSNAPNDLTRLPNNLREFKTSSIDSSGECGSWHTKGTVKSRQVIIPNEKCFSMFRTAPDSSSRLVTEIYLNDRLMKTVDLIEMQNGVEVEPGISVKLINYNPPTKKDIKMFCSYDSNKTIHKDCYEYNFVPVGNPSQEGVGSFQQTKLPVRGVDNSETRWYFGRNEWNRDITWFREGSLCEESKKMVKGYTEAFLKGDLKSFQREKQGGKSEAVKRLLNKEDNERIRIIDTLHVEDGRKRLRGLGLSDAEVERLLKVASPRFGWLIAFLIMLAILVAVAAIATPLVMWNNDKDNCCGIERYGTTGLDWMTSFARNINESYAQYTPEFEWTSSLSNGEPIGNSLMLREVEGKTNEYLLELDSYKANIDNSKIIVEELVLTKAKAHYSGSTGSVSFETVVVGSGGTVKLRAEGAKLLNNFVGLKSGRVESIVGLTAFNYDTSRIKLCIEADEEICSEREVEFVGNPDGENNSLGSTSGAKSGLATFQQLFNSNAGWATTYVLVCILSGIVGIVMIVVLWNVVKNFMDYELKVKGGENMRPGELLTYGIAILSLFTLVGCEEVVTQIDNVNRTAIVAYSTDCYNSSVQQYIEAISRHYLLLSPTDTKFIGPCNPSRAPGWSCVKRNETDPTFPLPANATTGLYRYNVMTSNREVHIPYEHSRAMDYYLHSTGKYNELLDEKTGKWYCVERYLDVKVKEGTCNVSGDRKCFKTKFGLYQMGCGGTGLTNSKVHSTCYGCYGSTICGWVRTNNTNTICKVAFNPVVGYVSMLGGEWNNTSGGLVASTNLGIDILVVNNNTKLSTGVASPAWEYPLNYLMCTVDMFLSIVVVDYMSYFSGDELWAYSVEYSISLDKQTRSGGISVKVCDDFVIDSSVVGFNKCNTKYGLSTCIVMCEVKRPDRPGSDIGKVKRLMAPVKKTQIDKHFARLKEMKVINRVQGTILSELTTKGKRQTVSKMLSHDVQKERELRQERSNGEYVNTWLTVEGVAYGAELGGPYKVFCYYGDSSGTFCNNTQGFGILGSVTLKGVNSKAGIFNIPEKEQGINLLYEGIRCKGIISDNNGTIICDSSCCMVSFDNFVTVDMYYAGELIYPKSELSQSYVSFDVSREGGDRDPGIYPQRVNAQYNETCKRGASVQELWECVYNYYPVQFWGPIGFIIAAAIATIALIIWKYGMIRSLKKLKSGLVSTGKWVNKKGKGVADMIYLKTVKAKKGIKIKLGKSLMRYCKEVVVESFDKEDVENCDQIMKMLEKKIKYWKGETNVKGERVSINLLITRSRYVSECLERIGKEKSKSRLIQDEKEAGKMYEGLTSVEKNQKSRRRTAQTGNFMGR